MSNKAIIVENLWKGYQLGVKKSGNLRESLTDILSFSKNEKDTFWALQNVNFEINQGDAIGIIGRNRAGKSTLLKLLSRITSPTKGKFQLNGRTSSLLEVGTGFHAELTGRENIFLNGTILGMTKLEIKKKFDEIVDFSGIEKFIDTPVKRYSSGMYVRLAFAVAAHLEPEILIVDEVLAVGIWLSALTIRYRDFQYVVPFFVQFGLYVTPIAYPSEIVINKLPSWADRKSVV